MEEFLNGSRYWLHSFGRNTKCSHKCLQVALGHQRKPDSPPFTEDSLQTEPTPTVDRPRWSGPTGQPKRSKSPVVGKEILDLAATFLGAVGARCRRVQPVELVSGGCGGCGGKSRGVFRSWSDSGEDMVPLK